MAITDRGTTGPTAINDLSIEAHQGGDALKTIRALAPRWPQLDDDAILGIHDNYLLVYGNRKLHTQIEAIRFLIDTKQAPTSPPTQPSAIPVDNGGNDHAGTDESEQM